MNPLWIIYYLEELLSFQVSGDFLVFLLLISSLAPFWLENTSYITSIILSLWRFLKGSGFSVFWNVLCGHLKNHEYATVFRVQCSTNVDLLLVDVWLISIFLFIFCLVSKSFTMEKEVLRFPNILVHFLFLFTSLQICYRGSNSLSNICRTCTNATEPDRQLQVLTLHIQQVCLPHTEVCFVFWVQWFFVIMY